MNARCVGTFLSTDDFFYGFGSIDVRCKNRCETTRACIGFTVTNPTSCDFYSTIQSFVDDYQFRRGILPSCFVVDEAVTVYNTVTPLVVLQNIVSYGPQNVCGAGFFEYALATGDFYCYPNEINQFPSNPAVLKKIYTPQPVVK